MQPYIVLSIVIVVALWMYLSKKKSSSEESVPDTPPRQPRQQKGNQFEGLRNRALSVTAEQLQLGPQTGLFGMVMDWDIGEGDIATLVTFTTGDASMYLSSGGGVIGGGQHKKVRDEVEEYIALAQEYLPKAIKTESTPLPDKDCINFYFRTIEGTFHSSVTMREIDSRTSDWMKLFESANDVISELRKTTEQQ